MTGKKRWGADRKHLVVPVTVVVVVLLLVGGVLLQYSIDGATAARPGYKDSSPFDASRSILDLLGGVRETLAAYFWTKTDVVFHEYLGADVVRSRMLYPYYWMITRLDPHFTMAYYYASWYLCRLGHVDRGFDLALEGVRYNPNSPELQENLGEVYLFFKKDPKKAFYHMKKAMDLTGDKTQKGVYGSFLGVIAQVLAGQRPIPEVGSFERLKQINESIEQHEHGHEHGE